MLLRAENVFLSASGAILAPGEQEVIAYTIDPDFFSPSGRSVLLGLHVRAADGSDLDPAAVEIRRASELVASELTRPDLGEGRESLALAELAPGSYDLIVRGENGTTGGFVLDVFLVGDANGDQAVSNADVAAFTGSYGSALGGDGYRASADANLDGRVSLADLPLLPRNLGAVIRPATIVETSPANGEGHVNLARETIVRFSERIDPATITPDSFHLIATGERVPGRILVSSTERFATFFYDTALPASTEVRIVVDGNRIRGRDGALLDADGDGVAGGVATADFRTLPLTRIPGTNIFGYVYDSYNLGPDGENIPVVGATIRVDAFPEANATTDETGFFILRDMPAPEFFVHIDGTTAVNAPAGTMYPSVGKPFHTVPGQEIQLSMMGVPFNVYLPPMAAADVVSLSPTQDTPVGFGEAGLEELETMFPELDPSVWDRLKVTFPAGSAVDNQGLPATQAVVIPVPPDRIPAPLPPFVDPKLVISIQVIGAENFDVPAPVTFPNLDDLAPGEKTLILSFDHDAGRWKSIGSGTVSDDGLTIVSDPGVGVLAPGWHITDPISDMDDGPCSSGSGGSASPPAAAPVAGAPPVAPAPVIIPPVTKLIVGDPASEFFPDLSWGNPGGECSTSSGGTPSELPPGALRVKIEIDGPLAEFAKKAGDQPIDSTSEFVILDPTVEGRTFRALSKFHFEMFGSAASIGAPSGLAFINRDQLYGAKITVTEEEVQEDMSIETTVRTFYAYRWIAAVHPGTPDAMGVFPGGGAKDEAAFHRTVADGAGGFVRSKRVDMFLPTGFNTEVTAAPLFETGGPVTGGNTTVVWRFDPIDQGVKTENLQVVALETTPVNVGAIKAIGTATAPTTINVNLSGGCAVDPSDGINKCGFKEEFKRVVLSLREVILPGPDGQPGDAGVDDDLMNGVDDLGEYLSLSSDDRVEVLYLYPGVADPTSIVNILGTPVRVINTALPVLVQRTPIVVGSRFKGEFAGFMPSDRSAGPDGMMFTADDAFSGGDLDMRVNQAAQDVMAAILADYAPVNIAGVTGYMIQDADGDVDMTWFDHGPGLYGAADRDIDEGLDGMFRTADDPFIVVSRNANLSEAAKQWNMVEVINKNVNNEGGFDLGIHLDYSHPMTTFAQFLSNTVAHEIGHTFGLRDAYVNAGVLGAGVMNTLPYDIMRSGNAGDEDLFFELQHVRHLQAALGMHADGDLPLTFALGRLRANYMHATSAVPIRVPLDGGAPAIAVSKGEGTLQPGDSVELGVTAADGANGATATAEFVLTNHGQLPLTIDQVALVNGTTGFTITNGPPAGHVLAVGDQTVVRVAFDPALIGPADETLRITSNSLLFPSYDIQLSGVGIFPVARAEVVLDASNNLGGVSLSQVAGSRSDVLRIINRGAQPLVITDIQTREGTNEFGLIGWSGEPVSLAFDEALALGFTYDASALGFQRGVFEVTTNDPSQPTLRIGAMGTGIADSGVEAAAVGNDFVAVEVTGNPVVRTLSDNRGGLSFLLPPRSPYRVAIYDPITDLVANGNGQTAPAGRRGSLTSTLVYRPSEAPDSDFDGLPDDAEFAIGTGPSLFDTDGDGIDDRSEIEQGLDPLDDRGFPTGIISALPLAGQAIEVVVEGETAYVATADHGLVLVDVGAFNNPILLGQIDLAGTALDVAVDAELGIAAVATQTGLAFVDVSDPMVPSLLRSLAVDASHVEVADGLAYVVSGNTVSAIDLESGAVRETLQLLGSFPITGFAREGTALFTMDARGELRALDISAGEIVARGSLFMPTGGGEIFVGGGVVYAAAVREIRGGYATADVSDLDAPINISPPDVIPPAVAPGTFIVTNGSGLGLLGGTVAGGQNTLFLLDASDPQNTFDFVTQINLPAVPASAALASGIGYIADREAGLVVVNYVSFDSGGQPPVVTATAVVTDADAGLPGVQVSSSATIPVLADISDDVQIRLAELLADGVVVATDVSFPFDFFATGLGGTGALTLQVRATDTGGNAALSNLITLDVIPDVEPPAIISLDPADGASFNAEEGRGVVRLEFSERLDEATLNGSTFRLQNTQGNLVAPQAFEVLRRGRVVEITYAPFAASNYTLIIDADQITDLAGNRLAAADLTRSFTVLPDQNPPSLIGISPIDDATTTAGLSRLILRFSEPMAVATVDSQTIQLQGPAGDVMLRGVDRLDGDRTLRLLVPALISGDYELTIDAPAITDRAGNPLAAAAIVSQFKLVDASIFPDPVDLVGSGQPVLADINEDGRLDRLTGTGSSFGDPNIYIDLGEQAGRFGERLMVAVAAFPSTESDFVDISTIQVADFNADGNLDLFVASTTFFQRFVAVLLGDGTGNFVESFRIGTAGFPNSIAVGHMNGDNNLDLVVATNNICCPAPNDGRLQVLSGNGDGTFGSADVESLPNGVLPRGLALADLDEDGDLDVAVGQIWQSFRMTSLIVLRNNGAGQLTRILDLNTNRIVDRVFAADVNADDHVDIVFAQQSSGIEAYTPVSVIYGDGAGGFSTVGDLPLGNSDRLIAVLDVNDDGNLDIVTGHIRTSPAAFGPVVSERGLEIYAGDSAGGFSLQDIYRGPRTPTDLLVRDIDLDGDDDLLSFESHRAEVLLSNDDGTFDGWEADLPTGNGPRQAALGDLDDDGDLDLVSTAGAPNQQGTVSVQLGQGDGRFGPADATNISDGTVTPDAVVIGDVDGDGDLDVVTANRYVGFYGGGSDGAVSVLLGNGSGVVTPPSDIVISSDPVALALGDIDGDGDLDIVAATRRSYGGGANSVVVLRGVGGGQFAAPLVLGLPDFPASIALGDVDNDDDLDIITANNDQVVSTSLFRNLGAGTFDPAPETPVTGIFAQAMALADLDDDDDLDLVISTNGQLAVSLGGGAVSGFEPPELYNVPFNARVLTVADVDRDGHPDVMLVSTDSLMVVAPGLGDGTVGPLRSFTVGLDPVSLAAGDLDNDDDLDFVTVNHNADSFSVRLNSIILPSSPSPAAAPSAPVVALAPIAVDAPAVPSDRPSEARKLTASRIDRAVLEWPEARVPRSSLADRLLARRQRHGARQRAIAELADILGARDDAP
jgi:hypothetical protein